ADALRALVAARRAERDGGEAVADGELLEPDVPVARRRDVACFEALVVSEDGVELLLAEVVDLVLGWGDVEGGVAGALDGAEDELVAEEGGLRRLPARLEDEVVGGVLVDRREERHVVEAPGPAVVGVEVRFAELVVVDARLWGCGRDDGGCDNGGHEGSVRSKPGARAVAGTRWSGCWVGCK